MIKKYLTQSSWYFLSLLLISLLLICLHVITYVDLEQPIYSWDYTNYSRMWMYSAKLQENSIIFWLKALMDSVRIDDYNQLSVAVLFPFYHLPLNNRVAFILAISICYLTPVVLLLTLLFKQLTGYQSYLWLSCIFIFAFTFPVFWGPLLRGYPDIAGLIPILGIILFILKTNLADKFFVKNILIIGILLWLPFALRRWYAYTVVSLYLTLPFFSFFVHGNQKDKPIFKRFYSIGINFILSGIISLSLIIVFQKELLFRILTADYSYLYSAYQFGHWYSLLETIKIFGLYLFPLFATGLIWSIFTPHKSTAKYLGLFATTNLAVSYILFTSTQSMGYHHYLQFALWLFILKILGLNFIINLINPINLKKVILVASALFSIIVFAFTFYDFGYRSQEFSDDSETFTSFSRYLFSIKNHPLRIENFDNYQQLSSNTEQWIAAGKKVTFITSSHIFNEDMIASIAQDRINNYLTSLHHVDLRDKIGLERFLTDYVVVGDPVQTHLPTGQNVVTIPASELLSGTGIGAAYQRLPYEYELAQGIKAVVFEKIRPFTQQEIQDFLAKFIAIYPDWANIYLSSPLTTAYMTADILLGDSPHSTFQYYLDDKMIFSYPGETKPVQVNWEFGAMQALMVAVPDGSCGMTDGVLIQLSNEEGLQRSVEVAAMSVITIEVSDFAHTKGTLIIDNNGTDACDSVFISAK